MEKATPPGREDLTHRGPHIERGRVGIDHRVQRSGAGNRIFTFPPPARCD